MLLLPACSALSQAPRSDSLALKADSVALKGLDNFFTHQDSLEIFDLIDSLLKMEPIKETSQMAVRLGYNSNISADNRTFNISTAWKLSSLPVHRHGSDPCGSGDRGGFSRWTRRIQRPRVAM